MQYAHRPMRRERPGQGVSVADVALNQRPPLHELGMAIDQAVVDHRREPRLRQPCAGMGADIPGPAGNQDRGH